MKLSSDKSWMTGVVPMIDPDAAVEIISQLADLTLVISPDAIVQGIVANPGFDVSMKFDNWAGRAITEELTEESVSKFEQRFEKFLAGEENLRPLELNHRDSGSLLEFPIRYSFHKLGESDAILMLGRDLRPIAEMQQQLVAAQIALEKDYEAQREYDTRFRVLMGSSSEATIFVSVVDGLVAECNQAASKLLGIPREDLLGSEFGRPFENGKRGDVVDQLVTLANADAGGKATLNLVTTKEKMIVRPVLFRSAGEQMLLCRVMGRQDAQDEATTHLHGNLMDLYNFGVDAVVFAAPSGAILSANEAFLNMADITNASSLKGRSISEFLGRGSVDVNVVLDNAARSGAMRLYATRLLGEHGGERPVEISTSHLTASGDAVFALMIRDASRIEKVRPPSSQITDVDMRSVIELIGSQSLKDIVAKTTDVVEKMCIETAVELTSNNRVAAADMLGLSRQSLYVKLRKYDLL